MIANVAPVAGPPSPLLPYHPTPSPANKLIKPVLLVTNRTVASSPMYTLSLESTVIAVGIVIDAMLAGPPLPLLICIPVPANVVMIPTPLFTSHTLRLLLSAMYKLPLLSTANEANDSWALVAAVPSLLLP